MRQRVKAVVTVQGRQARRRWRQQQVGWAVGYAVWRGMGAEAVRMVRRTVVMYYRAGNRAQDGWTLMDKLFRAQDRATARFERERAARLANRDEALRRALQNMEHITGPFTTPHAGPTKALWGVTE